MANDERENLREAARLCVAPVPDSSSRRRFLCAAAGALGSILAPSDLWAQTDQRGSPRLLASVPQTRRLDFRVLRNGSDFGKHSVVFTENGDELQVEIDIELRYQLGFLTLFRYVHHNTEVWRGGHLVSLDTKTDDDGTPYRVAYRAEGDKAVVDTPANRLVVPGGLIPTSYWNIATVNQKNLLNTQTGEISKVDAKEMGPDTNPARGAPGDARRYRMTGDLDLNLWYSQGVWVKIQFEIRGQDMEYVRL